MDTLRGMNNHCWNMLSSYLNSSYKCQADQFIIHTLMHSQWINHSEYDKQVQFILMYWMTSILDHSKLYRYMYDHVWVLYSSHRCPHNVRLFRYSANEIIFSSKHLSRFEFTNNTISINFFIVNTKLIEFLLKDLQYILGCV